MGLATAAPALVIACEPNANGRKLRPLVSEAPSKYLPEPNDPRRCHARKSNGEPCSKWAIKGCTVCGSHGGKAPQVRAAAEQRMKVAAAEKAVARYGLAVEVDPIPALLQELHRSAGAVAWLNTILADANEGDLTQQSRVTGSAVPSALWEIYTRERAHFAKVAKDCASAGIEERRVQFIEEQGRQIADVIRRIVVGLGLDPGDEEVRGVVRRELTVIDGGAAA
jgi:hypothetical protein